MNRTMNPVVHFEMPADDRIRMANFYTKAFGWQTEMLGPDMGNYVLAATTESGEDGRPKMPGAINGGFFVREPGSPDQHPSIVIAVEDIGAAIKRVKDAGGKVLSDPMPIPGVGLIASFLDTEGNRASILQPNR